MSRTSFAKLSDEVKSMLSQSGWLTTLGAILLLRYVANLLETNSQSVEFPDCPVWLEDRGGVKAFGPHLKPHLPEVYPSRYIDFNHLVASLPHVFLAHRSHGSIAKVVCPSGNYWSVEAIAGNGWYPGKPQGKVHLVGPNKHPCKESIRVYARLYSPTGELVAVGTSARAPPTPADLVYPATRPGARPGVGSVIAFTDAAEALPSSSVVISFQGAADCSGTVGTFYVAVDESFDEDVASIKATGKTRLYATPAVRLLNLIKRLRGMPASAKVDTELLEELLGEFGLLKGVVNFVLTNPAGSAGSA